MLTSSSYQSAAESPISPAWKRGGDDPLTGSEWGARFSCVLPARLFRDCGTQWSVLTGKWDADPGFPLTRMSAGKRGLADREDCALAIIMEILRWGWGIRDGLGRHAITGTGVERRESVSLHKKKPRRGNGEFAPTETMLKSLLAPSRLRVTDPAMFPWFAAASPPLRCYAAAIPSAEAARRASDGGPVCGVGRHGRRHGSRVSRPPAVMHVRCH